MIYFEGPSSSAMKRSYNLELTTHLEKAGFSVFLPQRDGIDVKKPPYRDMKREEQHLIMFEKSRDLILACDVFLFIVDGRVTEEGDCFNLGLAYAHRLTTGCNRLIIGMQTDNSFFLGVKLNPILKMALDVIVDEREALSNALVNHKNTNCRF